MAKSVKSVFFCQECGYESGKWMGQCPACHAWNTFVEEKIQPAAPGSKGAAGFGASRRISENVPKKLSEITFSEDERTGTRIGELDRVLGGGIVRGSLVLIGGDPGIGKSTLLLQMCHHLTEMGRKVLYISGEESLQQIKMRANRLGGNAGELLLLCETDLEVIQNEIAKTKPSLVVIDSIQTMYSADVNSAPGSVTQVREATAVLLRIAKSEGIIVFIVGHVTKDGSVAGPRVLEHMVDTVLYFEGENHASYRVLRAVKNRFGSTNEIGVFEMAGDGLREVENPSEYMLSGKPEGASGAVVTCQVEGSRPILLEIQALVSRTSFNIPRRTATGMDYNRVNLLIAVLEKRIGCDLSSFDAYVNIAGGIRIGEPSADLAVILALLSSYTDKEIGDRVMVFGEVGLSGEVRAVTQAAARVQEAKKLGFEKVIMPKANLKNVKEISGIDLIAVNTVKEAVKGVWG
ncbi:MAG: DNA repair protein RadA [Lachnospiraceae bacterium]|nr:DNA repair protein RadA [Lachnospiraceae bacterium]